MNCPTEPTEPREEIVTAVANQIISSLARRGPWNISNTEMASALATVIATIDEENPEARLKEIVVHLLTEAGL